MELRIPGQVVLLLRGRCMESFEDCRQKIWKAVASVPKLAAEFSAPNCALMSRGLAPKAPPDLQVPGITNFNIVHVEHPSDGGELYNLDNIRVISPLRRYQIMYYSGLPFEQGDWNIDFAGMRPGLIELVERLLSGEEDSCLTDEFENNVLYPYAADLVWYWADQFEGPQEIVDFALGLEKPKSSSRDELVAVARRLMTADVANPVQSERLSALFKANVAHPEGDGLIFHPKIDFNSVEELVAHALTSGA
jgi:hypothetical protein